MSVSIKFLGAAGTVTGSKTLLQIDHKKHLVDCGLFQGPKALREENWKPFEPAPSSLASVILTHAHLDHTGYLPKLCKEGFSGPIHASQGTSQLSEILLLDSAHLQEEDAQFANTTKHSRHAPALPLYRTKDAEKAIKQFQSHPRNQWIPIDQNFSVQFLRSGHIIGSSFVHASIVVNGRPKLLTFSGDIGHSRSLTLKGPVDLLETDYLVLEATYGDRRHPRKNPLDELAEIANKTFSKKGVLVIPAFSVGRSQEIVYLFRQLENENRIPKVPILLDSPMSNAATEIYLKNFEDSPLHTSHLGTNDNFYPQHFESITSVDDSMTACMREGPMVVISAAGMLNGGRILHHLKHRLPHQENTILFVGYQAEGTKGRFLQDFGQSQGFMRIHHQEVIIEAEIATLSDLSAHGDAQDILEWLARIKRKPSKIFLNHGSPQSCEALKQKIEKELHIRCDIAEAGKRVELWR